MSPQPRTRALPVSSRRGDHVSFAPGLWKFRTLEVVDGLFSNPWKPARCLALALALASVLGCAPPSPSAPENRLAYIHAVRSAANPLIVPSMSPTLGDNINGPSVIRVPEWVENPLGRYYMYFAHHQGKFIRLAYADALEGPWRIQEPGVLHVRDARAFRRGISSPDVHVDHAHRRIVMFFHGPPRDEEPFRVVLPSGKVRVEQQTGVAVSGDGLSFAARDILLGRSYFRVFPWKGAFYAIAKSGRLFRSEDPFTRFEQKGELLDSLRHAAILIEGDVALVFYSRIGDAPERILVSTMDLVGDPERWALSEPIEVLRPEASYEGIGHPVEPSVAGKATEVRQLRDPYVHREGDRAYLFYSFAGESGIAMAELTFRLKPDAAPR